MHRPIAPVIIWSICLVYTLLNGCNESGGCGPCPLGTQVVVTSPDGTPPDFVTVFATFADQTQGDVSVSGTSQEVTVLQDDILTIVASGGDPEGPQRIRLWIEETYWNGSQQVGPGLLAVPAAEQEITAAPGDNVCTPLRVTYELKVADRLGNYDRIRFRIWSESTNLGGLSANSATLTLNCP